MAFLTMSKVALLNLFKKPATRMYPFKIRPNYDKARGMVTVEIEKCIFCKQCQIHCPADAITVDKDKKLWKIDRMRCVNCGRCCEVCPKKCIPMLADRYQTFDQKGKSAAMTEEYYGTAEAPKAEAAKPAADTAKA